MTLSQADIDSLLGSQPADDVGSLLDKPATGEDIATALQDPTFTPTVDQYKQFEEYNKTKQTDWLQTVLSAADSITQTAGQAAKAAVTTGAALNPKNYLEGLAQGTAQLYGLVAQSQNPDSPLFKLNNLISGTGTLENRYTQFIQARQFNKDLDAYAKGDMTIMFPPEQLNPEFVQGVAMVADPTMFLPGIGQVLGVEKVGAKAVGKAAQIAGRGVQAVARPVEMAAGAAERAITGITGVSPEALRGGLATSGVLAATGAAPAVGLIGAVPLAAAGAMDVGRAVEAAGAQLGRSPTRIGALEAVGAIPEANLRQRVIGTIGRYGGDAALNAALVGTTGSIEGAAIGGVLGYLSGGEEGAAAGIGSGAAAGALGSLGARGVQTLTGQQAKAARLNDLTTYIDTLPENKKAAYQSVQERFGTDTASNLMDLETAIRGTRSDIAVDLLTGDEFKKQAGVTARGIVPQENAPTPRILINVDAFSRGKGDTPIYTLGHELVHALASTKQFQGDITALTERLTGAYIPNPDGTMRLTAEGEYTPAKVEELFNQYVNKLPDEVKAKTITDNPTAADRAAYVGEELVAEQVGRILSSQKPDAFLRGFGTTRQSFTDMLILQDASRAASRIGQYFERTFGVTPSDSILFPEVKQSSPILDASLRQLLKARENISEALQKAEFQKSFAINQNNISDPTVADFAVRGGFAVREPDGTVRLLTNGELLDREQRDVRQVKEIVDKLPGARFDIDGNLVGQLSKEQADALNASSVSSQMKERITAVNQAINEGRSVLNEYYPATEKKQDPQSKRWRTRYAGRRMTFRETLFYNLLFSKEGNAYARGIDLTKIRSSLQKHVRNGGVAGLWPDVGAFMGDLAAYLTNRERGENAIPTRQLLGSDKAEFMGSFLNNIEKGGSEFIHSFRLDRFGKMDPGDFRARFGEAGYQGMKNRLMPAGTVGDAEAFKSQSGYTVLSKNNKFRLYGPDGALLGIYDSSQKAEKKIHATQTRLQPEIDQLQRSARDEVRQTPEAGGRNRPVSRTQGSQEGGEVNQQVRQAGDVGRFMPDYSGEHKAPNRDYGAPLSDLTNTYPEDIYGPNAARYYGSEGGSANDKAAVRIIQATKGKPDADVGVFRAVPKSVKSNKINPGDWVTTIKDYAVMHGEGPLGGDYKILKQSVKAGDLYSDGNSIFEYGYDPSFMPSDADYLAAVQAGDTQAAQQMVDQAAKAAGYTVGPVYHGTPTGGFNVFDKRMRGETSGVGRDAFSFTTNKQAAESYSKRLGDDAVRLDAGLRVANDAMRMFDNDIAAQEYFTSKGYTSVEDGMLPEFDWGSIEDVPEFINELRGYAEDLKPINKQLSDSFIQASNLMESTKSVPEVKRVFLRIPENAPVFKATPETLAKVMFRFSAESQPTKSGIVELPRNERIYYVADSSQVKVADPITRDDSGNVIPLSQRFQQSSADIRYMPENAMPEFPDYTTNVGNLKAKWNPSLWIQLTVEREPGYWDKATDQELASWQTSDEFKRLNKIKSEYEENLKKYQNAQEKKENLEALESEKRNIKYLDEASKGKHVFIRFGKLPSAGLSFNAKDQIWEKGVSVYDGFKVGNTVYLDWSKIDRVSGMFIRERSPTAYLVSGELTGSTGSDGEPLIVPKRATEWKGEIKTITQRGMQPRLMPQPDPSVPGAYSVTGGFRILPGKTKGRLRVYGPSGALVGIAGSLDEAQRMIRKKTQSN